MAHTYQLSVSLCETFCQFPKIEFCFDIAETGSQKEPKSIKKSQNECPKILQKIKWNEFSNDPHV